MTSRHLTSSWVRSLSYHPYAPEVRDGARARVPGTHGFLILHTRDGNRYAYSVPSWIVGLLMATYARTGHVGSVLNRWVIGKWPRVKMGATT